MKKLLTLLLMLLAVQVHATDYYVSPSGANTTCTNARSPATPAGPRLQFVMGCMVGGDTLIARGGAYEEPLHKQGLNGMFPNGTAAAPTVFKAFPGETVWLKTVQGDPWGAIFEFEGNSYITFDGISWDGSVSPASIPFEHWYVMLKINASSHHIRIMNGKLRMLPDGFFSQVNGNDNELSGLVGGGYYKGSKDLSGGNTCGQATCWGYFAYVNGLRNKILRNEVYDIPSWVVHAYCFFSQPPLPPNYYCSAPTETLVQENNFHDYGFGDPSRASGILIASGNANAVIKNAVWNNKGYAAIDIGPAATNTIVQGNTYVAPPGGTIPPEPAPSPLVNTIDVRTDRTVTITGTDVRIGKDKATVIIVNGMKR
jgi:hypothetical protein